MCHFHEIDRDAVYENWREEETARDEEGADEENVPSFLNEESSVETEVLTDGGDAPDEDERE